MWLHSVTKNPDTAHPAAPRQPGLPSQGPNGFLSRTRTQTPARRGEEGMGKGAPWILRTCAEAEGDISLADRGFLISKKKKNRY